MTQTESQGLNPPVAFANRIRPAWWRTRDSGDWSVLSIALKDALGLRNPPRPNREHLQAAMGWLCAAQDATKDDGVAAFYDLVEASWAPSYPETTGYIIPTFYDYADYADDAAFRNRAGRMAEWLLTLQLESGAFPMGPLWPDLERKPVVFDTGQIIQGLVRAFEETGEPAFLEAGRRAGDWLVEIQDGDGSWRRFTFSDQPHSYNARTAWALLQLSSITGDEIHQAAALRKLSWVSDQQLADGWFQNAALHPDEDPLTHTLAYTIRGLLEAGIIFSDHEMTETATFSADRLLQLLESDGRLQGAFGPGWNSRVDWSCLVGSAQMAVVWLRLYELTGEGKYLQGAMLANRYLKAVQLQDTGQAGIDGGIAGSYPVYGDHLPYRCLNWAAKFFVDSLLLEERLHMNWGET